MYLRKCALAMSLLLLLVLVPTFAQAQSQASSDADPIEARVTVRNDTCREGVTVNRIIWVRNVVPLMVQLTQTTIRMETSRDFQAELTATPTEVQVQGSVGERAFEVTVPVGREERYDCGWVRAVVEEEPGPGPGPGPGPEGPELPPGMPRPGISAGMSPDQIVTALEVAGATGEVQGSEDQPKLGDADDPILVRAFASGLSFSAVWVTATPSLRASVTHDRPNAFIWLWVVPVPNFWNTAMAWSPPTGGLSVTVDRPQAFQPLTSLGDAPVTGNLFFVLIVKWDTGPPMPYVLSLSN
ncbi:MAG: hypothetical protein R6U88_06590 [Candidatus Bipolaricaulota bacterium]